MDYHENQPESSCDWQKTALIACQDPTSSVECPVCHAQGIAAEWNRVELLSREAVIDLHCSSCNIVQQVRAVLPDEAPDVFPVERLAVFVGAIENQVETISSKVRRHIQASPAAMFVTHPLWAEARWSATTYQWHPTSESPPIMGVVFDNAEPGMRIFRDAEKQLNHADRFEEIRISIIEGAVPGQEHRPGYTVHICPEPESLSAHAAMDDFVLDSRIVPFLGQWNRVYPNPGQPALLPRFKQEFEKHREFLLAPVTRRDDGQLWCNPELGIVKNHIEFRNLADISESDPDAAAILMPQLIAPPM